MAQFEIVRDYPHAPAVVWRAVTDPSLVPLWTSTGKGARPVGFAPVVGTRFQFVAKPMPGWRGIVDCEVLEVREPSRLRYTWVGDDGDAPSFVTYQLTPVGGGTRFTYTHTGLAGIEGLVMARVLRAVRTKMLTVGLPAVLDQLDEHGELRPGSALRSTDG